MPVQNYSELGNVWILRFDGGSRGNPGIAGSGSVLYKNTVGNEVWSSYNYLGNDKTNNYAEYADECINQIFTFEIYLEENKRLESEEDKVKLKNFKNEILDNFDKFERFGKKFIILSAE